MASIPPGPQRIAILGGGPAGVAAAYWLSRPEQKGQYIVTLYTQGWRLGGKCASGRNLQIANRIEEHGLHMLMGCYQNGFATMRALYEDWRALKPDPTNAFQHWSDAFLPLRLVSLMEQDGPGTPATWLPWLLPVFPRLPGEPGDGPLVGSESGEQAPQGDEALILQMVEWMKIAVPEAASYAEALLRGLDILRKLLFDSPDHTPVHTMEALQFASQQIQKSLEDVERLLDVEINTKGNEIKVVAEAVVASETPTLHRLSILLLMGVAIAHGFVRDILDKGPGAYDALNGQDFKSWLRSNLKVEADADMLLNSAPVKAFYDLTFAAIDGNPAGPGSIAAGCALKAQLEMVLGYRNAPLWKMAAGMGDTVFTPFYDVLTARGVNVQFFSRIVGLTPNARGWLSEIDVSVQAVTINNAPYKPLVRLPYGQNKFLDCWPNQPDWTQLQNGTTLQSQGADFEESSCTVSVGPPVKLLAGKDFDLVISALPPDSLRPLSADLMAESPSWTKALNSARSVATQSLQLWMGPNIDELGWGHGTTVVTSFTEPYDSWGDMSQVIPAETWGINQKVGSIGYFCGCLEVFMGPVSPPMMGQAAASDANRWMGQSLSTLWPGYGGVQPIGQSQIVSRYGQANYDMSDRYVQTPAGDNVSNRLLPGEPTAFGNLYVIGDWTKTRFSGGCFESAIESAMLASRAISGVPQSIKTN